MCLHGAAPCHHPILHPVHLQGKCIAVAGASYVMLAIQSALTIKGTLSKTSLPAGRRHQVRCHPQGMLCVAAEPLCCLLCFCMMSPRHGLLTETVLAVLHLRPVRRPLQGKHEAARAHHPKNAAEPLCSLQGFMCFGHLLVRNFMCNRPACSPPPPPSPPPPSPPPSRQVLLYMLISASSCLSMPSPLTS